MSITDKWIDISVPLNKNTITWPGTSFTNTEVSNKKNGDFATANEVTLNVHFGTHIDAPLHHIINGSTVDQIPLGRMNGQCRVLNFQKTHTITGKMLESKDIKEGEIILLKTDNSKIIRHGKFDKNYCALDLSAATYLAQMKISLIGIDYLSIQKFDDGPETHEVLLNEDIVILESIDLSDIAAGNYSIICLPMALTDLEAAPCRVLLSPIL